MELTAAGVELTAEDGQKYDLMYPRFLAEGVELETGDRVAVEGFLVPGPRRRWDAEEDKNYLRIEKATVDGKEYELAGNFGPGYMHGHRPRGGAYGPGKMGRW